MNMVKNLLLPLDVGKFLSILVTCSFFKQGLNSVDLVGRSAVRDQ
jgi:hypothetical protein